METYSTREELMDLCHKVAERFSELYPEARFEFGETGVKIGSLISAGGPEEPDWVWFWSPNRGGYVAIRLSIHQGKPYVDGHRWGADSPGGRGYAPFSFPLSDYWGRTEAANDESAVHRLVEAMIEDLQGIYPETEIRYLPRIWPKADESSIPTSGQKAYLDFLKEHGPQARAVIIQDLFNGRRRSFFAVERVVRERGWVTYGEREQSDLQLITPSGEQALHRSL